HRVNERRPPGTGQGDRRVGLPGQCATAFSEPAPVRERTSISANLPSSTGCLPPTYVPMTPRRNESGIDTRPGLASGKRWKSTFGSIDVGRPEIAGEKTIRS